MDKYGDFAYIYDKLMDDFDYKNWAEYINSILIKNNIYDKDILEMACGTGSLTLELLKLDYKIDAFDLSVDMLTIARDKLKSKKNFRLFNLDMRNFQMNRKYKGIICPCDSLNYILTEGDLKETFDNVYSHLEDEGVFIFDINSFYKLTNVLGDNLFLEDREEVFYTWENSLNKETNIVDFYLTFFVLNENEQYNRFDEHHKQRAYETEKIIELLNYSGFREIKVYEGFTFERIDENTQRLNFIAKK